MKKRNVKEESKPIERTAQRVLYDERNIQEAITFYTGLKIPFSLTVSNFTVQIDSELEQIAYVKYPRSRKFFSAYQKLVKSINGMPIYTNEKYLKYHNTGFIYEKFYADKIYQIDIKSCYASILRNSKLISTETFQYLSTLPKAERLSSVGAMASRKTRFTFNAEGTIEKYEKIKSTMSDFFFYCVQETFKIMSEAALLLGKDYLFTWVDAIYFTGEHNKDRVYNFFTNQHNLDASFSELTEFEVELIEDCFKLQYRKDGVPTYMYVPTPQQSSKVELENYLKTYKKKKHEQSNEPNSTTEHSKAASRISRRSGY